MAEADTIAAVATAPGRGAVGMIRVSGPQVPQIALSMLGKLPAARVAQVADFLDGKGESLDRGVALYFPAPASFTGEHVLELQGHGGVLVLDLVLNRVLELGCRMARPGEFSERAFLNGKIDIAQAEAVADLIDAGTSEAARAAVRSMQGEFSAHIHALQARITELRTLVEANIDFPDEELDFVPGSELGRRMAEILTGFEAIIAAARQGALLREGLNVVIAGKPNAGKSSLLNKLVGDEIAIVTDQPGTTRDVLRQQVHLDGLPLNLIDTAGLRQAHDVVEAEGVRRAFAELGRADRVIYILDAAAPAGESSASGLAAELGALPHGVPVTLIFNKIDLSGVQPSVDELRDPPQIFLSAKTGAGLDLLRAHLKNSASYRSGDSGALSARRRHLDALNRAKASVVQAADSLSKTRAFELFAEDLRLAQQALGEITGEFSSEDLLGEIFGSFCIGK
ncbi:MAG TPA: tRNA uridine-5-carboxymethylaminomethyl(34) synthesis GTPase MnmE [Steroidobacteraceae bacterium]|nr:tRNA uridine-5-carboxymethylaminomethyl(34) synthesis GTPase MnmE [Steroidobacteraceae bacterium]